MYEFPDGSVIGSDLPAVRVAHIAIGDVAIATGGPARNLQGAAVHTEASLGMARFIVARRRARRSGLRSMPERIGWEP
jgi:hypothetical protein